jgi:hypothetical protein
MCGTFEFVSDQGAKYLRLTVGAWLLQTHHGRVYDPAVFSKLHYGNVMSLSKARMCA